MEMVTYLNEYPTAILGGFDPSYLELPEEILITVMRDHQKYFALERRDGTLAPNFLAVINLDKDKAGLIRAGHERVLRARFADARFFWETDQKCRLADYLPKLAAVTYQEKLGSYGDKVERMRELARWLCRAMVCQRNSAGERGRGRSRRRAFQVRPGHGDGPRVYRAAGNRRRPLRKISRRT
jgi:glycyl-tRNA synthetase beta chain